MNVVSCIFCENPCDFYFEVVAKKCYELFEQEATEYRQRIAELCEDYKPRGEYIYETKN